MCITPVSICESVSEGASVVSVTQGVRIVGVVSKRFRVCVHVIPVLISYSISGVPESNREFFGDPESCTALIH